MPFWTSEMIIVRVLLALLTATECLTFPMNVTKCEPGPKSGNGPMFVDDSDFPTVGHWGEGCDFSMGVTGTDSFLSQFLFDKISVKPHGHTPTMTYGHQNPSPTTTQKRTFRRACNRAIRHGFSWYHGKQMTPQNFPATLVHNCKQKMRPAPSFKPPASNHAHAPHRRIRCLQWNCSGLSTAKLDEIRLWSISQAIDMIVLCETRWNFTSEWTDGTWSFIHSGDTNTRSNGILIMIRLTFCKDADIQFQHVQPGRILHVRLHSLQRPIDLVAVYQFMNDCSKSRLQQRQSVWSALDRLLYALPKRNTLLLTGDFNCNVQSFEPNVGWGSFYWQGTLHHSNRHSDVGSLMNLLREHGLVVLNSWNPKLGPTYKHGDHASSIDFMVTRLSHADGQAKQPSMLADAPFLGAPDHGHIPLLGNLPYIRIPSKMTPPKGFTSKQRQACRQAWKSWSPDWNDLMLNLQTQVAGVAEQAGPIAHDHIGQLHERLTPPLREFLTSNTPDAESFSPDRFQVHILRSKWDHLKAAKALFTHPTRWELRTWLHSWFHIAKFSFFDKQHKQHAKILRKKKAIDLIQTANRYASQHDSFRLHHLIRTHSPKVPRRRIQIRNLRGELAHPHEEFAIIHNYMSTTWNDDIPPTQLQLPPPGIPFSEDELCRALQLVPATKAVAKPFLPGIVIKMLAPVLASHVYRLLQSWWSHNPPFFPAEWQDSWITFLAKPGKCPDRPEHLRAIALQEPIGKCVTGLLAQCALTQCFSTLAAWPQFAYLPHRSCQDAILRVSEHCRAVRHLIKSQRLTVFDRAAGVRPLATCGGIQLFLDLSKAFDCVNRSVLFEHLSKCGISVQLIALIQALHADTKYNFFHAGVFHSVPVTKGVRQGCKIAPLLWACFMHCFLTKAASKVGVAWVKHHLTLFADDMHIGVMFTTADALHDHLIKIGHILDTLRDLGLTINMDKSTMLFAIAGTNHRRSQSNIQTTVAGKVRIRVPTRKGNDSFGLETQATYLGVIMSYRNFEDKTVQTRISAAKTSFRRLTRWLTGSNMHLKYRLRIWHSCILPVLQYGIFTLGLASQSLRTLQTCMYQMLRSCLRDHAYYTGNSHQAVLHKHNCPTPLTILLQAVQSLLKSVTQRPTSEPNADITNGKTWTSLLEAEQLILNEIHQGPAVLVTSNPVEVPQTKLILTCTKCDFHTDNIANLRRHYTNIHKYTTYRNPHIDWTQAALDGLPTCKHCNQSFTTWRSFKIHIERQTCQVLPFTQSSRNWPTLPEDSALFSFSSHGHIPPVGPFDFDEALTLLAEFMTTADDLRVRLLVGDLAHLNAQPFGEFVMDAVRSLDWTSLTRDREACTHLTNHCALCGIYVGCCRSLLGHLKLYHGDLMPNVMAKSAQLTYVHAATSPCPFCLKVFKKGHVCPVLLQASLLLINGGGCDVFAGQQHALRVLTCEICAEVVETVADLNKHLRSAHRLATFDWNPSRDSTEGSATCAHCNKQHTSLESLRCHITFGHCANFDASRTAETRSVDPDLAHSIQHGLLLNYLQDSTNRTHLTLKCLNCGEAYNRCSDLTAHLQTCHCHLWRQSSALMPTLTDYFLSSLGCICNPSLSVALTAHVCVGLRQIAMQFSRMTTLLLIPQGFTHQSVITLLHSSISDDVKAIITAALLDRHFERLWTAQPIKITLRQTCVLCGAQPPAADLCQHIQESHFNKMTPHILLQILPYLQSCMQTHVCDLCHLPFDSPHNSDDALQAQAAQTHLRALCPVTQQIAVLLSGEPDDASHGCGRTIPAHPGIPGPGRPHDGSEFAADPTSRSKTTKRPASTGRPRRSKRSKSAPSSSAAVAAVDQSCDQDRQRAERLAKSRFIRLLSEQGERSTTSTIGPTSTAVASREESGSIFPDGRSTETPPDATCSSRTAKPDAQSAKCGEPSRLEGGSHQEEHPAGGWELALPTVELHQADDGSGAHSALESKEDGHIMHSAGGVLAQCGRSDSISFPETHAAHGPGDSLEVEDQHAGCRHPCSVDSTLQQCGLEPAGSLDEITCTDPVPTLPKPSAISPKGTGQGQGKDQVQASECLMPSADDDDSLVVQPLSCDEMRARMLTKVLLNDLNWCYANAVVLTLLWTAWSNTMFSLTSMGMHFAEVVSFLNSTSQAIRLQDFSWFQTLFRNWNGQDRQQDACEFLQFLVGRLESPWFHLAWEKRVMADNAIQVSDRCEQFHTLVLQFPETKDVRAFSLQELMNLWHHERNMIQALKSAPDLLCIQLDRFQMTDEGMIKLLHIVSYYESCMVPVFDDQTLSCHFTGYVMTSAVAHFGDVTHGHYRSLLRCEDPTSTNQLDKFLLADDNHSMTMTEGIPLEFRANTMMIWLSRTTRTKLYSYQWETCAKLLGSAPTSSADTPEASLLKLLSQS